MNKTKGCLIANFATVPALAPENRSEYKVGIYLYDKAGNRIELSRRSVIDRVKPDDIIQVQDATTGSWVTYQSGMTVFQNPISVRVLRKKSDFTAVNGKRLVRTVLIFTESSDQLSRATDRVPGLPASPGYVQ
ncbi:Ig-like domain repeat protein [Escherichia coli]|uniref:Ig-like domain repeat protein n=1 Tax=Escherichia coli TaxID=562 RepID=UPI003D6513BB